MPPLVVDWGDSTGGSLGVGKRSVKDPISGIWNGRYRPCLYISMDKRPLGTAREGSQGSRGSGDWSGNDRPHKRGGGRLAHRRIGLGGLPFVLVFKNKEPVLILLAAVGGVALNRRHAKIRRDGYRRRT